MMKLILYLIILLNSNLLLAQPSEVKGMHQRKEYQELVEYYLQDKNRLYSRGELVLISGALRRNGYYREDLNLNIRLVKKMYREEHQKLTADVKAHNTVDPDEYTNGQKLIYWFMLNDYVKILESYKKKSPALDKDYRRFQLISKLLVDLEFRESKVDKLNNIVNSHLLWLSNKIYHFTSSFSFQYVSWQREANLVGPDETIGLNVTNRGYCVGGDVGMENYRWHFYVDGCFLSGSGSVQNPPHPMISYQQSNLGAVGFKMGPGVSMIVSSSKSRIGLRLPMIYTIQRYQNPPPPQDNYKIEETNPLSFMATLYARYQFGRWYLQTEFGQYFQAENIFWGIGVGRQF